MFTFADLLPTPALIAGYVRQSSAKENNSEASPATQRAENRKRADSLNGTWVGSYEDIGISAFSGEERPEFERLIADCKAGRVNVIIVYYISRLSRMKPMEIIPIVTDLLNRGVVIISVTEGIFREGNVMDLLHLIMRLDAAHTESKNKSTAIKGAKDIARELGGYVGGKPPYGMSMVSETRFTSDGKPVTINLLTLNPTEIANIQEAANELRHPTLLPDDPNVRGGQRGRPGTLGFVCRNLNERGVPTRGATTGKKTADSSWHPRTLERILRDPRIAGYAAEVIYREPKEGRKAKSIKGYRILRDPETLLPIVAYPSILPPAEWWEIQQILDRKPTIVAAAPNAPSLLSSMNRLFCECGTRMKSNSNSKVAMRSSYRCARPAGRRRPGEHTGDCTISKRGLDDYVARRIYALISTADAGDDPETLAVLAEATRLFGLAALDPATAGQRAALEGELADAEQRLEELYADRAAGGYKTAVGRRHFLEAEHGLSEQMEALAQKLGELDATVSTALPIEQWLGEPGSDPIGPGSWWASAPLPERRAMVALFIKRITVRKSPDGATRPSMESRVTIEWITPKADEEV
ncbi:hypothetical protein GCM10010168_53490 [Actinoplanes ianthinogenes]|uniref:Recombinase family protein n=1 Tax=Actinoplanes ianthinogenes TaxID=122358 RepID=A0ABN6C9F5_9ACTN|nr:recombinase family protein [Actinoplanes ianthinogenes]BCJ41653.1 hypothetical protein Aiant_23100 [Actinoplanes ianthinogenes]GGR28643.1 hypothetical protein GCM10010168_53490 [Actinoplanes ianthinogenes]